MNKKCSAFAFVTGLTLASCVVSESRHTITLSGETIPVEFLVSEKCDHGKIVDFNTIGNLEIAIVDSLAVISTSIYKQAWKIISLEKDSVIAEFLDEGNGPNELTAIPLLSQASFVKKSGHKVLAIPDFFGQRWHYVDLGKLVLGTENCDSVVEDSELGGNIVYNGLFEKGIEYRIAVDPVGLCIKRMISIDGKQLTIDPIERLNEFKVVQPNQLGLLMPTVAVSSVYDKVAEVYNIYPQINLYSLSTGNAITLLPNGKPIGYGKYMEDQSEVPQLIYRNVKGYEEFFVVNKIKGENETELQFFTWDGTPLRSMVIPAAVTSFDIDFKKSRLLAIDYLKDEIREYKLPSSIGAL